MLGVAARLLAFLCIGWVGMGAYFPAQAEEPMKTINNPGGGQITYGPMPPQHSVQMAMGEMLRQIHNRYGERPQVGRFFQDRSGQALAAFFNVTARNAGGQQLAGLVMVSVEAGGKASAAILSDDAKRFPQTVNPLLQRLTAEWTASSGGGQPAAPAKPGAAEPLRTVAFPDNSGSIGLPAGWKLISAQMGAMEVHGPNGEKMIFGVYIPVMDPNFPQTRYMMNMETQGGRVPLPGLWVAIPWSTDVGQVLKSMAQQLAQKQRRPAPTITVTKVTDSAAPAPMIGKMIQGDVDAHDGAGLMSLTVKLVIVPPPDQTGNWGITIFQATAPKQLVDKETPTIAAISASYKVNTQVVQHEVDQQIQANNDFSNAVLARQRSTMAAMDQKLAHDRANEDARDRSFQAFDNVIIGQSVVQDTWQNRHGTISNDYADALVKSNPDRFQYVPTQDYLKGIDY